MQTTLATPLYIGVDVSKDAVLSCVHNSAVRRTLANQRSAIEVWLKGLPAGSAIGMEATGSYHELLADRAHRKGMRVYVLNPKDVRHYAKGIGMRAKTDRVDATLIARYIAHEHTKLHPYRPPAPSNVSCSACSPAGPSSRVRAPACSKACRAWPGLRPRCASCSSASMRSSG